MSNSFRIDVTLPIKNWNVHEANFEKCTESCENLIKALNGRESQVHHLNNCIVIPEADILSFCKAMLDTAKLRSVQFKAISVSKSEVVFTFSADNERLSDKFYYNLVYLLAVNGILKMQNSIKKR